jgi:hypothetical protein
VPVFESIAAYPQGRDSGRPFFWLLFFWREKKSDSPRRAKQKVSDKRIITSGRGAEYATDKTQCRSNFVKVREMHSRYYSAKYYADVSYLIDLVSAWLCRGMHSHAKAWE